MRRSQALPSFRRPPNDIDVREHNESHKRSPSPDSSISRIFYKSGPLNSKHHKMRVNPKVILKGAWITSEMSYVGDNNEQIVKCTLTELAIFLAYLIVLMIVHPENQYDLTHAMEKAFLETSFISNDIRLKLDEGPDYANGKLAWYPRVGSLIDLPSSSGALADIIALQNSLWVARGVRAVILHYNLYNINLNCFCFIKFIFEVPPTGGFIPSWNIHTTKVLKYVTAFDFFVFGLELGLIIFIIIYTFEEARELKFFGCSTYFTGFWNWIDVFILSFSFIMVFILFVQAVFFPSMVKKRLEDSNKYMYYVSYFNISRYNKLYDVLSAIVLFLAWCKVFKFMTFTKKMDLVVKTLKNAACKVYDFGLLILTFYIAFSFWGFFLFHSALEGYSTLFNTCVSLLLMCHGEFDFNALRNEDEVFGPIFIIMFLVLFYFLVANLVTATISEAYQLIKENGSFGSREVTPLNFLSRAYYNLFCRRKKLVKIYKEKCPCMTYTEIYDLLKRMNFTREEISMFFSKYNIKSNQKHISQKQIDEIETDLKIRKFIPLLPQDVERHLRTKEKHAIRAQKEKRFANSRYHVFTYAEYEILQAQLDQIEILLELSTANLYELLKIFQSGVKYKWMVKEESDAQSECCNISPGGHANSDPTSSDST